MHPISIARIRTRSQGGVRSSRTIASKVASSTDDTKEEVAGLDKKALMEMASTTLSSKIVNILKKDMAAIAVDAVLSVADLGRKDVNFDMIKMQTRGGKLEDTSWSRELFWTRSSLILRCPPK